MRMCAEGGDVEHAKKKVKIRFAKLLAAFLRADESRPHYLDTQESLIVSREELQKHGSSSGGKVAGRFVAFPAKSQLAELSDMEMFAYEVAGSLGGMLTAESLLDALKAKDARGKFMALLSEDPKLLKKWEAFRLEAEKNLLMDWLFENGIELGVPPVKIRVREIAQEEWKKLPSEVRDMKPRACLKCGSGGEFARRLFACSAPVENRLKEAEAARALLDKHGLSKFDVYSNGRNTFLLCAKCKNCGSEEIFMDF